MIRNQSFTKYHIRRNPENKCARSRGLQNIKLKDSEPNAVDLSRGSNHSVRIFNIAGECIAWKPWRRTCGRKQPIFSARILSVAPELCRKGLPMAKTVNTNNYFKFESND